MCILFLYKDLKNWCKIFGYINIIIIFICSYEEVKLPILEEKIACPMPGQPLQPSSFTPAANINIAHINKTGVIR